MLRPCLCTGSVSHVHLECLNRWRATSSNAYFTCSVCRYNYLIKRTLWAELLVWEPAILGFAVLMVLAVCVFLGLIVSGVIYFFDLSSLDPLRKMLELMEVDAYWMRCLLTHRYQPGKELPLRGGQDFNKVISAIYNSTSMGVSEKAREFIRLLRSPLPMRYFICHPTLTAALNVFLLGALPIGCLGFFGFFIGWCSYFTNYFCFYYCHYYFCYNYCYHYFYFYYYYFVVIIGYHLVLLLLLLWMVVFYRRLLFRRYGRYIFCRCVAGSQRWCRCRRDCSTSGFCCRVVRLSGNAGVIKTVTCGGVCNCHA